MAAIHDDEIVLIEHISEDAEGAPTGEQDNGTYGIEVCVVENMNPNQNDDIMVDDDDTASAIAGDIGDIELEEGKEYHLFFCHSSVDLRWIVNVVKVLEAPPYNLQCAYSERDFMPGRNDMNEMFRCITGSIRTVFVLTPAFIDSRWCEWEMQMAQTASVANNISLLPIMLQECPVPDTIKHINYIDVTHGDTQQAALKLRKNVEKPGQGFIQINSVLRINGSSFPVRERMVSNGCCQTILQFELPPDGVDALEQKGITIPEEEIKEILQTLTLDEASMKFARSSRKSRICNVLFILFGVMWFIFWLFDIIVEMIPLSEHQDPNPNKTLCSLENHVIYTRKDCNILYIRNAIVVFLGACSPLISQICICLIRRRKLNKVIKLIKEISLTTMKDHKMYIWFAKSDQYLRIVKYDIRSCLQHLIQQLDPNIVLFDIDDWKVKLTEKHFPLYMEQLMLGSLDKAHIVVHPTVNNQICFCQYIQAKC